MPTIAAADPNIQSALRQGILALNRVTNYVLPAVLDRRMQMLGENKEFLCAAEHEELLALVAFTHDRTIEKLQAELALREMQPLLLSERLP